MKKIPITIGIIGHLDSVITEKHNELLLRFLDDLNKKFPESPVVMFSLLAKGADTWGAKLFLNHGENTNRNYELHVPLPMSLNDYKTDFSAKKELEEFENLLSKAKRSFEIKDLISNKNNLSRDEKYRLGGKFLADSSMILIALFDGIGNDSIGGTSDIIFYKQHGAFKNELDDSLSNIQGLVVKVPCTRLNHASETNKKPRFADNLFDHFIKKTFVEKALKKIERSNKLKYKLLKNSNENPSNLIPRNFEIDELLIIEEAYSIWDKSSQFFQKKYFHNLILFSIFGMFLLLFFEIYRKLDTNEFVPLVVMGTIILIFWLYNRFGGKNNHLNYIEDRVLAESLRVQFFWTLGNIHENVTKYILRIHRKEYNWINIILNAINGLTYSDTLYSGIKKIETVVDNWIINQENYFEKALIRLRKTQRNNKICTRMLVFLAMIIFSFIVYLEFTKQYKELESYLILALSLVVGGYIAIQGFYEKRAYEQLLNQYELMYNIFNTVHHRIVNIQESNLSDFEKEEQIKTLFFLAGKEALVEKGNWYIIFKDKELELEGI